MKCKHKYKRGIAIENTISPDCRQIKGVQCTLWAGGPGKLIPCMKCVKCGHSVYR